MAFMSDIFFVQITSDLTEDIVLKIASHYDIDIALISEIVVQITSDLTEDIVLTITSQYDIDLELTSDMVFQITSDLTMTLSHRLHLT